MDSVTAMTATLGLEEGNEIASTAVRADAQPNDPPRNNAVYKERSYWETRFEREDDYEWLGGWDDFSEAVTEALEPVGGHDARVLVVGCGNSSFSSDMYESGFSRLTNIDFSAVVIDKMRSRHPHMDWRVMDMLDMAELEDGSFDAIVDKAAMDALVTDEGDPWNPNAATQTSTTSMVQAVQRVLRPGGRFLQISFQQPHFRRKYLTAAREWDKVLQGPAAESNIVDGVAVKELDCGMGYFLYSMVSTGPKDANSAQ